jgi:hypothetical protein
MFKTSSLSGKRISKKEALKGLGKIKDWDAFSKKIYEEFRKKPEPRIPGSKNVFEF